MKEKEKMIESLMPFFELAVEIMSQKIKDEIANKQEIKKLFFNLKELELITGITYLGLKGRIKRGTIKASKNGNTWLISSDEVERIVNQLHNNKRA